MVDTHSYRLSPLGPALQLGGGSSVISASSFCILFAEVLKAFDILGLGFVSLASLTGVVAVAAGCGGGGEGLVAPLASELLEPWWTRLLLLGPAPDVDMEQLKI